MKNPSMTLAPSLYTFLARIKQNKPIVDSPQTIYVFEIEKSSIYQALDFHELSKEQWEKVSRQLDSAEKEGRVLFSKDQKCREEFLYRWITELGGLPTTKSLSVDFGLKNSHKPEQIQAFYIKNLDNLTVKVVGSRFNSLLLYKVFNVCQNMTK